MRGYYPTRVAPFGYLRLNACLTAPRSFSQLTAPFVASLRLGILHTLFVACPSSSSSCRHATNAHDYPSSYSLQYFMSKNTLCAGPRERGPQRQEVVRAARVQSSQSSAVGTMRRHNILRKEVIQPQVPLRLPCYDFTPVTSRTLGSCVRRRFARSLPVQPTPMV